MTISPTRKLLRELAKKYPFFEYFDPLKAMNLNKGGKVFLDHAASLYLAYEESKKDESGPRKAFTKLIKLQVLMRQNEKCNKK